MMMYGEPIYGRHTAQHQLQYDKRTTTSTVIIHHQFIDAQNKKNK